MTSYSQLEKLFTQLYRLDHFIALGEWDMRVNMPPKGTEARGAALAELMVMKHDLITDAKTKQLLDAAEQEAGSLDALQRANLREMKREWALENLQPAEFVEKMSILTTRAEQVWCKSREENDFNIFLPTLRELVEAAREKGRYLAGASGKDPYEALVDIYEPGMTLERLDAIFGDVKAWLPAFLKEVMAKRAEVNATIVPLQPPFPVDKQEALGRHFMKVWDFDFDGGRLDVSAHPFCGNVKEDVRITTNYREHEFETSLLGVIHETGHAKYEQNCGPEGYATQPICRARSLGFHESQSLFAEMQIGRSSAFIELLTPQLVQHFGDQPAFTPENMKKILHRVEPGYIRIDADEVCYPLHVILRYEIERGLLKGDIQAEDVPRVWNEKMQQYFGLETTGKDNIGCLQDIHWAGGLMGYFPTYSLGAMIAAQLMAKVRKDLGSDVVDAYIREGKLSAILARQKEMIWQHGCALTTEELLVQATGEPLNPTYFREHLRKRYLDGN